MKNFSLIAHQDATELIYKENNHITGVSYLPLDRGESIIKPHLTHHFVLFVLKGEVELSCKYYNEKIVSEGHMTFLSKGGFLQVSTHTAHASLLIFGFDEISIHTSDTLMSFFTIHGNKKAYIHNTLPVNSDMKQIVDRIVLQVRKGKIKNTEICQAWNIELFITFITYYTKTQITEFFRPLVSTDISFRDFVENNYTDAEGSAEKLIQYSGISRSLFIRTFKKEFGTTPKAWMMERFKKDLRYYASRPNATTSFVASCLRITDVRLCQLTRRLYDLTPQQLIAKEQASRLTRHTQE